MAKKSQNGGVNKSAEIRKLYEANPNMKVKEVIAALAGMGITAGANLVYLVKGKAKGEKTRRRRVNQNVAKVATVSGNNDAVKTIIKVKALAAEVGGLRALKALVEALSE